LSGVSAAIAVDQFLRLPLLSQLIDVIEDGISDNIFYARDEPESGAYLLVISPFEAQSVYEIDVRGNEVPLLAPNEAGNGWTNEVISIAFMLSCSPVGVRSSRHGPAFFRRPTAGIRHALAVDETGSTEREPNDWQTYWGPATWRSRPCSMPVPSITPEFH